MLVFTTMIKYNIDVLFRTIRQEKEIECIQLGKKFKIFLFVDDMDLYIENLKSTTEKIFFTVKLIQQSLRYKVITQNCVAFVHTNKFL